VSCHLTEATGRQLRLGGVALRQRRAPGAALAHANVAQTRPPAAWQQYGVFCRANDIGTLLRLGEVALRQRRIPDGALAHANVAQTRALGGMRWRS